MHQAGKSAEKIDFRLGCSISFSNGRRIIFGALPGIKKDANLICTVLAWQIWALKTSDQPGANARVFYLQTDGGSENINK